jgi:hypothetical protein
VSRTGTSCAIRGARGGGIGHRSPPGSKEELGWAGCGPGGRGSNLAPGPGPPGLFRWPLTPIAGSLAPPPCCVLAAAGRRPGRRPRVFPAHRPLPQLASKHQALAQDTGPGNGNRRQSAIGNGTAPRCPLLLALLSCIAYIQAGKLQVASSASCLLHIIPVFTTGQVLR